MKSQPDTMLRLCLAFCLAAYGIESSEGQVPATRVAAPALKTDVPANVTPPRSADYSDLRRTGKARVRDRSAAVITYQDVEVSLDDCSGAARFTATDAAGNNATAGQRIRLTAGRLSEVVFPPSYCVASIRDAGDLAPENLPTAYAMPVVKGTCSQLQITWEDRVTGLAGGGCGGVRIVRKWTVCNPCHPGECREGVQVITGGQAITAAVPKSSAGTPPFELLQNRPNPFSSATVIGFRLPAAATAELTLTDISGRVLYRVGGEFEAGYHEINVDVANLHVEGVLFYTLATPTHRATKRMGKVW